MIITFKIIYLLLNIFFHSIYSLPYQMRVSSCTDTCYSRLLPFSSLLLFGTPVRYSQEFFKGHDWMYASI